MTLSYYKCTANLWSLYVPNQLKFSKDGIYECIKKDVYVNNQNNVDYIAVEGWQQYFITIDLEEVNIEELTAILEPELILASDDKQSF